MSWCDHLTESDDPPRAGERVEMECGLVMYKPAQRDWALVDHNRLCRKCSAKLISKGGVTATRFWTVWTPGKQRIIDEQC